MAEAIVSSVAEGILKQLGSPVLDEIGLWWGVNDNLKELKRKVALVKAVLLDAEEQSSTNNWAKEWLGQLKQVFLEADDLLDEVNPDLDISCCTFFSSIWNRIVYGITLAHRVPDIIQRLNNIADDEKLKVFKLVPERSVGTIGRETHSYPPAIFVGREDDKRVIMDALLSGDCEDGVGYISIVGIGGLGKTTLAQLVFNDEEVKKYFERKFWVCVSDNFVLEVIIANILGPEQSGNENLTTLARRLHEKINGKRYLLVLDDVWSENQIEWRKLTDLLVGGSRGSRVIVTTRLQKVSLMTQPILVHKMQGLSDMHSWNLLKQMAFSKGQVCSEDHEKIGKEILKKCCGVPLAIRAIGGLLFFKQRVAEWQAFKNKEIMTIDEEESISILPVLEISYNHLPPHLKNCFVYCRLFPKDCRISVSHLINYWVAQGFVKVSDASQCPTDVGLEYFKELSWRSFFQEVEEDKWGNVSSCKMHDLIHDLATKLAGVESVMFDDPVGDYNNVDGSTLHASFLFRPGTLPASLLKAGNLRTLLLPNGCECKMDVMISKFKRLRTLHLRYSFITKIPHSIGKLKHMRHLDLTHCNITVLPDSIGMLYNLLILILHYCPRLKQLPGNTQNLVNLTELVIVDCDRLTHMPQGMGRLTSLHKLTTFVVAKNSSTTKHAGTIKELGGLNNLRGNFEIINLGHVRKITEFQEANLKRKQHLQGLNLDWGSSNNFDDVEGMALEALEVHQNLKWLRVCYYRGSKIPRWLSSLVHLEELRLYYCVNCRHLPPMHQLYNLKRLFIKGLKSLKYIDNEPTTKSAIGGRGESTSTTWASSFFPSLESLVLGDCPNLEGWWTTPTESRSFPRLSKLEIFSCPKMTSMPLFPTLEVLTYSSGSVISLKGILNTGMAPAEECTSSSSTPCTFSLHLEGIEDLESLQEDLAQNLHSLKTLSIRECNSLGQALQHLTSLESLHIFWCDNLKCLPEWMGQRPSLQNLIIDGCSQLSERCGSNKGADWPNIASIPNIKIDGTVIQENGRYMLS